MSDKNFDRWFQLKENDAWVIKGMLANGGDSAMIARVFHAQQSEVDAIASGESFAEVQYPGSVPYPDAV
jgi:hypothetical protein